MKIISVLLSVIFAYGFCNAADNDCDFKGKTLCVFRDRFGRKHKRPFTESWHAKLAEKLGMEYVNFGRNGSSIAFDRTADGFGLAMTERYLSMPGRLDKEVIAEIHKACDKYDIPVLDVSSSDIIDVNNPEFRAKYFQGPNDTAHLNDAGHDLMVERGEKFIKSLAANKKCCNKRFNRAIPRDTSFTAYSTNIKVRKHHPEAVLALAKLPAGVKEYNNVVYTTHKNTPYGDRDMHVDIFRPDNNEVYPALIMIHGGGWNSGDKSLQVPMAQQIAAKGYVTIPVEYRMTPEAKYPAALHDIKTVVRWARANASKYGIDPDKIAGSGVWQACQDVRQVLSLQHWWV